MPRIATLSTWGASRGPSLPGSQGSPVPSQQKAPVAPVLARLRALRGRVRRDVWATRPPTPAFPIPPPGPPARPQAPEVPPTARATSLIPPPMVQSRHAQALDRRMSRCNRENRRNHISVLCWGGSTTNNESRRTSHERCQETRHNRSETIAHDILPLCAGRTATPRALGHSGTPRAFDRRDPTRATAHQPYQTFNKAGSEGCCPLTCSIS